MSKDERKRKRVAINDDLHNKLSEFAQRKNLSMQIITERALEEMLKYDFTEDNWESQLAINRYEALDNACPLLYCLDDGCFYCIGEKGWKRKLGAGSFDDAMKCCDACGKVQENKKQRDEFIKVTTEGIPYAYYYCARGGELDIERGRIKCPDPYVDFMKIEECKSSGCKWFRKIEGRAKWKGNKG